MQFCPEKPGKPLEIEVNQSIHRFVALQNDTLIDFVGSAVCAKLKFK